MRRPLLMMRARGLTGPLMSRHAGARASHPLSHSSGVKITIEQFEEIDMVALGEYMTSQGWTVINQTFDTFEIQETGGLVTRVNMNACFFDPYIGPVQVDLEEGMNLQGFCL